MNRNRKLIGLAVLLVVLLAGGMVAYNYLAPKMANGDEVVPDKTDTIESVESGDDAAAGETAGSDGAGYGPAPDFTVYDASGNAVSLSDFAGQPVVVNFWATWCPPCKQELPEFDAASQEYGIAEGDAGTDGKARFLMVALTDGQRETKDTVDTFIAENGYTFPVYYDLDYSAVNAYGINSIPMTLFIDADGNLQQYYVGMIDGQKLQDGLAAIL